MDRINNQGRDIFELIAVLVKVYFKDFENSITLPNGLNHTHIRTLIFLCFKDDCPMSVISEKANIEKGSFTPVANKLIRLGYIEKRRDNIDKRIYNLHLTTKGKKFAKELSKEHMEHIENLLSGLSSEDKQNYFKAIKLVEKTTKELA